MTREAILDLCKRRQRAMDARDVEALAALHAEAGELDSPLAGSSRGREAARRVYAAFFAAFPDAVETTDPPIVDGDRVAIVATVAGTHAGEFMGLPASGKSFRFSIAHVLTVRDGLIVRERRIYDFTGFLLQLGVLKAKPV